MEAEEEKELWPRAVSKIAETSLHPVQTGLSPAALAPSVLLRLAEHLPVKARRSGVSRL